jgi:hypothetical protein
MRSTREAMAVATDAEARVQYADEGEDVAQFDAATYETSQLLTYLGSLADIPLVEHQQLLAIGAIARMAAVIVELKKMAPAAADEDSACFGGSCSVDGGGC